MFIGFAGVKPSTLMRCPIRCLRECASKRAPRLNSRNRTDDSTIGDRRLSGARSVAVEGRVDIEATNSRGKPGPRLRRFARLRTKSPAPTITTERSPGQPRAFRSPGGRLHDGPGLIFEGPGNIGFRGLHRRDETKTIPVKSLRRR